MSAQVQTRDYQDTVKNMGSSHISATHINRNQEIQQNNKNETQQKDSLPQQKAIHRLMGGLQKVLSSIDFEKGMADFTTAFDNIQTQQIVRPINSSTVHIENISFAPNNVDSLKHEEQIENLNKTPFFGSQQELIKSNNAKKEGIQSLANKIISKISNKNQQAMQQFSEKVSNLISMSFPKVFQKILSKSQQAIQQFAYQYQKKDSYPQILQSQAGHMERISTAYFRQNQKILDIEDDNQFMTEQFGTQHRLEQVKKYVDQIKTQNIQRYLQENPYDQIDLIDFIKKIQQIREKLIKRKYFQQLKAQREKNSLIQDQSNMKKIQDRSNSARVSQRMSSAQSQRLQSASKNSQNDQSFNLDLTIKTKLSKNLYQMGKGDSLMYSADSGFGFIPQNTQQNQNFEGIDQQKQRLIKSQRKGTLQKSHSERVQHQIVQKISKRIFSSKQKIQQFQQQQNEENSIAHKQIYEQNSQIYPEESQNAYGDQSKNLKLKYKDYQAQENQQNKNKSYIEQSKIYNIDKKQVHEKHIQQKSMKIKKKYQDQISQKEDTIINRVQNFDADDQDEQLYKSKQLNQSVNLKKSRKKEKVRKRVQTEVTKIQQQPVPKHNYSIKNIKRFNKVDFTKLQQKTNRSNSQATNSQNIFTTQISNYQNKITKLRQQKQLKKKHLQLQLARINNQIKILHQKQQQLSPENSPNNGYPSRVKISNNNQAQKKAQSLVKNLRSQKRNRNIAKIGQFSNLNKNINEYMDQLSRLRAENQQKIKYRKKIQILERMKQNQVRKMNQKKKITENQQFLMHLKGIGNENLKIQTPQNEPIKRSPTKQSQQSPNPPNNNPTPQLTNKKAYLNKIRSFSIKKQKPRDAYEQILG